MKSSLYRFISIGLCCILLFSHFACQSQTSVQPEGTAAVTEAEPAVPEQTEQAAAVVPDNGKPDKTGYPYLDAIAAYLKTDWKANWIWTPSCSEDSYVAFRKAFSLDQAVEDATAYISSVDKYVLWINGELLVLDGSVKRGPTPVDTYFDTLEGIHLNQGTNTIAVLVAFNGRSGDGSIVPILADSAGDEYPQGGLLFELHAGDSVIGSDETWKAARHTGYQNKVLAGADYTKYDQSSMLAERNVFYRASASIGDFETPEYDDGTWENAALIAKPGDLPFGDLYSGMIQTPKFDELKDFLNASEYLGKKLESDTVLELELPGNMQFTWEIELDSPEGKRLTIYTNTYTDRQNMPNFKDTYLTKDGFQTYENWPWRSGSKLYIEAEAGITFQKLAYRASGFHGETPGSFSSSNPDLDQLWQECLNTIVICMRDTYMDCPERERGPYMGDASNQIDAALYAFDQGGLDITKKALLACVAWTTDSNAIPSRAPSVKPQEIPNQSLSLMSSAYHYYLHSGDTETILAYYKTFLNYLKLFEMDERGLVAYRPGSWTWNDWGTNIDSELLQLGFYYYALQLTQILAKDFGTAEDLAFLQKRMDSIRENWREEYTGFLGFASKGVKIPDDRANAMLALSGLAEEADYPIILNVLTSTYEASPFTEKYLLEALCKMGYTDKAVERILKRYDPMLHDEWDTVWELYNDVTGTYNHGWNAGALYILSKYVAGIRPTSAGWSTYEICPSDVLDSFDCTVWTPNGTVRAALASSENGKTMTLELINGECTVKLPASWGKEITVEGGNGTQQENGDILFQEAGTVTIHIG